ncbi:aromatic ring-hydroxylating dioxygenase subunit alpha [Paenarthrobacter sp. NPDC057981]|uniref:aromatic ring-hydroxylating oxygenase subunit alpha n=1 Tax=Paenarthrobacter sp. NPDC057981 TaxID=3346297 RepID=UPI0036DDC353
MTNASELMRHQVAEGLGIPRELYLSEEVFDQEIEAIFGASWIYAGHVSQLAEPGSYLTVESGQESVIVARTREGALAANFNVCRHRGARLVDEGCGVARRFVCPYHQWGYDLDGSLKGAPKMPDTFDRSQYGLTPVNVKEWQGFIFVNLAERPSRDLEEMLSIGEESLAPFDLASARVAHTITYEISANWKLVWENAQECYHCGANHPEFLSAVDIREITSDGPVVCEIPPGYDPVVKTSRFPLKAGATSLTVGGQPASARMLGKFAEGLEPYTASIHIKPTFALVACPDYAMVLRDEPISLDKTRVTASWLVHKEAEERVDYDLANLIRVWDETNKQDWALCERTQKGVQSRSFVAGPLSYEETSVVDFHRAYEGWLQTAGL